MTSRPPRENWLYPRLDSMRALQLYEEFIEMSLAELKDRSELEHPNAAPGAAGGMPVPLSQLARLRADLREICSEFGYPRELSNRSQAEFDRVCGTYLYENMGIVPGDAAEQGVWSFLTLTVVPELGPWRFPARSRNRILGHRRNVLRRLWQRAHVLGPDLTEVPALNTPLAEDDFFQIMERATVSKNSRLARAVRNGMWRFEQEFPGVNRNKALRKAIIIIRAERTYISVHALSTPELESRVDVAFREAGKRVSKEADY